MLMRRLQGVDGYLWYNETPSNHMHTLKVAILDPAQSSKPYSAETFTRDLDDRMHLIPSFRWRLLETPLGLHHPVWVEDPDFDIRRHVFRALADPPGGTHERDAAIAAVAEAPLPRDRPLWQLHLVEGLEGGRVAAVAKIHHAMADGGAAANQLLSVTDDPEGGAVPRAPAWRPAALPSRVALAGAALRDHPAHMRRLPHLIGRTYRGARAARRFWRNSAQHPVKPWSGPRTFINTPIDARRTFASMAIALEDINMLRGGTDYTLNDLILATATGALRELLTARGEQPRVALVANVPIATGERPERLYGNSVGVRFVSLPVHLADGTERLRQLHDGMLATRNANDLLGPDLFEAWLNYVPPKLFGTAARLYATSRFVARRRPMMNVVVSNVRGPSQTVSVAGQRICNLLSVGPLDIGMGLNITVWSYAGNLNFTVLACPAQFPDAHVVTSALAESFGVLRTMLARP
jgi:diacylglycerol O-acyltransferase / wax synthase